MAGGFADCQKKPGAAFSGERPGTANHESIRDTLQVSIKYCRVPGLLGMAQRHRKAIHFVVIDCNFVRPYADSNGSARFEVPGIHRGGKNSSPPKA